MQLLIDYIPIVIFIAAYFHKDIYFATGVLMGVMPIVLLIQWLMTRKINRIYLASTALVLVLGAATLLFHNPLFLYWKPTVLNWVVALVFLGSMWIGDKPIVQRMLGGAAELHKDQWARLNLMWVAFFILVGGINIYVAYSFPEDFWVKFKLFGMLGMTLVFVIIQSVWLTLAIRRSERAAANPED
ncbi:MAG: septation protein IspZ [Gammaproteobacteria bacterium]|nr:septation protein IspZ [Gammaproteobacteria bacterium]MDH4256755.1 septation protein IspZ [Gammaproteobacteria bacterium]MDH5263010.1 septation protein IspZ [Gammaproteobacteria bacterium]